MSVFIAGKPGTGNSQSRVKVVLDDYALIERDNLIQFGSNDSFAYCYSPPKVMHDLFIRVLDSESWVLLVGTPILDARSDTEKQDFAREFFRNPKHILRNRIDGNYAILAYESKTKMFLAGSDWNSLIPVYYAITKDGPLFTNSELLLASLLQSQPDEFGFAQAIHYGAVWGDRTRFDGIRKLEACELVQINDGNHLSRAKYWEPRMEELWTGSFDAISDRWLEVMRDTIRVFADHRNSGNLSADLTGGEDSRLLVALLLDRGEPFRVRVAGEKNDADVRIALKAAEAVGLELLVENTRPATEEEISCHIDRIIANSDAYGSFFTNAASFAHELRYPPLEFKNIHLCGVPGGEQFRGSNYPRAKLIFPSFAKKFDYQSFTKRRFFLDFLNDLLVMGDNEYIEGVYGIINDAIIEVLDFPAGIQVDHVLRLTLTPPKTASLKRPFYCAFSLRDMTRSTYTVPPHMKQGGRQTKAITERLAPNLAWVRTQAGVPCVRKTLLRQPLFFPEIYDLLKKASKGVARQTLKAASLRSKGAGNARHHAYGFHETTINWLFGTEPYSSWFKSAETMMSGGHYNPQTLNSLLINARKPSFSHVKLLGRIINQEMAFRKIYGPTYGGS